MVFTTRGSTLLLLIGVVAGCASAPPSSNRTHSLTELQEIAERANTTADPYELGTGDQAGRMIHRIYRDEGMAAAQVE